MERQYVNNNTRSRERLRKLVNTITDEELKFVIYKEGWTVAADLAHLAFWDERRLILVRKWQRNGVTSVPVMDESNTDIINDALLPFLLAIPPKAAANLAVSSAEELDTVLEKLSPEMIIAIERLVDRHALDRSIHRKMHLDEIDTFLKAKRARK